MKRPKPVDRNRYPKGWNAERVQQVIDYCDNQSEDEQVAEFEDAMRAQNELLKRAPNSPKARRLRRQRARGVFAYKLNI